MSDDADDVVDLTAADRDALERALAQLRRSKDPERRRQIEDKLATEGWWAAASFAAYSVQIDVLGLKPWQDPPCFGHLRDDPVAYELAQRLERANLSIFEPNPRAALAAIEQGEPPPAA